jgi:hypothetical protein
LQGNSLSAGMRTLHAYFIEEPCSKQQGSSILRVVPFILIAR